MRTIFIILLLLTGLAANSQPPNHFYTKYGGEGIDIGYGVQEIYKRQYIVVGSTTSFGSGSSDAYLFLVDSMGAMVWQKTFGGLASDAGKSVLMNPADSGFVFCGSTNSFGGGGFDVYVVRTDKVGNLLWQSSFGGLDWDFGSDLTFAADGNLIVCGNTYNSSYGSNDGYVIKVNTSNGTLMREKKYGGLEDDEFNRIKLTSDGNFGLSGNTKSYGDVNNDFWFFKINNNCDSITSASLGSPNKKEKCYDFIEDPNNNLVFCGSYDTSFYNTGKNVSFLIRTNLNGGFLSDFKVSGAYTDDDKFLSMSVSKQGNEYFFSRKVYYTSGLFENEIQPFLLDFNYIYLSSTTYGGAGDDEAFKVISTTDNGFLMIGYTKGFSPVSEDVFLIKLNHVITGASLFLGLEEDQQEENRGRLYYYDGAIYLDNPKRETLTFEIMDSQGRRVQSGNTKDRYIPVDAALAKDIYFVRILEKTYLKAKFIKN